MNTKVISLILAVSVCFALMSGCQSSKLRSYSEDLAKESPSPEASQTSKDYTPCYEYYDPDEVMLTVNGIDVTWSELFYWYVYDVSNMENYYGEIEDWNAQCSFNTEKTNREYVMDNALDTVKHYCAVESKAKELGVTLTDEDKATLKSNWENNVKNYGGGDEASFIEYLKKAYLTKDMYDHINEVSLLYDRMMKTLFGANGEKLSENEVIEKASDMGYVRVKNLLISTKDDTNAKLPDDKLAEKKTQAENLLKELRGITDKAALEKRFDEMIKQYGGDSGTEYYAEGYTFIPGNGKMVEAFETASSNLSEYEVSDIVETDYGYHIILRLPLSATAAVEYGSDNSKKTLSYYVAQDMFSSETENWADESKVVYTKTYQDMDIAEVFSKATKTPAKS